MDFGQAVVGSDATNWCIVRLADTANDPAFAVETNALLRRLDLPARSSSQQVLQKPAGVAAVVGRHVFRRA